MSEMILEVIMPVYNEAFSIASTVEEVFSKILNPIPGSGLLVVDDGSSDGTSKILDELKNRYGSRILSKGRFQNFKFLKVFANCLTNWAIANNANPIAANCAKSDN